ncbi:MAG: endonuclease/exonuclease/phosphatase family protein [Spirochaetaceae bacterium]|nr:endonuclease/exonuclease/phosphatase family protein [Spirochaetaceae bacterium]
MEEKISIIILVLIFSLCSCSGQLDEPNNMLTIMSWNVDNLMDDKLDGTEYEEYTPSKGWDSIAYKRRLKNAAAVIKKDNTDIVLLQEIEHSGVLKDLLNSYLKREGYKYYGSIKKKDSAISIGFISKIKPTNISVHSVINNRSVLQLDFNIKGNLLTIFEVHAKSKYSGDIATEEDRINLSKILKSEMLKNSDHLVLMCGDFNEDPSQATTEMSALILESNKNYLPYTKKGSLGLTPHRDSVFKSMMYSPTFDDSVKKSTKGTYFYNGTWSNIDLILGSSYLFDGVGLDYYSFNIDNNDFLLTSSGIPNKWEIKGLCGISDHLPVVMKLFDRE